MQINKINSQTTNFKSRFVPNTALKHTLDDAAKDNDRFFLKSMKAILNDGKNDVLTIQKGDARHLNLYVNGEIAEEGLIIMNYYGNVGINLINKYASKIADNVGYTGKYNSLSEQEKKLVREDIDVIKLLSENFENGTNFIENVQTALNNIKQKLDNNAKKELMELKDIIFNK